MPSICPECKFLITCDARHKDSIIECEDFKMKQKMTLEELKAEADKLGYRLIKKSEKVKFLPCVCGCNRRSHWFGYSYYEGTQISFECNNCGLKSPPGSSEQEARQNWNKMIKEYKNNGK